MEIKFVAYSIWKDILVNWIKLHPAGFRTTYPDRLVNNVYFDSYDYSAFAQNLSGISERTKLRYRWYGEVQGPVSGYLEVKRKRNKYGWKNRFRIKQAPYSAGQTWEETRLRIREQLPARGRIWLDQNPFPVILNRYNRQYYCTADGTVRATVDTDQRTWDQRVDSRPNFDRGATLADTVVVEFKFSTQAWNRAAELLQGIPVRVNRHSKYVNGVRAISMA